MCGRYTLWAVSFPARSGFIERMAIRVFGAAAWRTDARKRFRQA
jgi:hypothetical protein